MGILFKFDEDGEDMSYEGSIGTCDLLHEAVNCDGDSIDGEGTHEADEIPLVEGPPPSLLELLAEALRH